LDRDMAAEQTDKLLQRLAVALERVADALERQAATAVSSIPPAALSKEDAARFISENVATIEHLIRTRKIAYVQHGSQRGRGIPVEDLQKFLAEFRQQSIDELEQGNGHG
jgi:hypothetical protein